jgi:hypothetical protein
VLSVTIIFHITKPMNKFYYEYGEEMYLLISLYGPGFYTKLITIDFVVNTRL